MIRIALLLLAVLLLPLRAEPWQDMAAGCSANLPQSAGWQMVDPPQIPGLLVLVVKQNPARGAVFGINVVTSAPTANLRDPATIKSLEAALRGFQYEFFGSSIVVIGGTEWRQYNVKSVAPGQAASGVVRYASAYGKIFGVSMLLGGGKEAAQDLELQNSAASVRFTPPAAIAVAVAPPAPPVSTDSKIAEATPKAPVVEKPAETKSDEATKPDYVKLAIIGGGVLIALLVVLKLIGGGGGSQPPPRRR